jgi:hypothetical protein
MAALTKFGTVSGSRIRSDRGGRCTEHGMMTRRKWHDNLPSRDSRGPEAMEYKQFAVCSTQQTMGRVEDVIQESRL